NMSDKFYQTIEIAGESEEDFLREAYLAWLESQVADEPVWPPLQWFESDFEDDEYDLPDPFEKKTSTDDTKKVFRPFYYDTGTSKSVAPDSIAPFMELLPNLELGGELRNIIDGMVEKGRLKSLSDISMMFRSKFEDAIRHRKYDPRILREADTYFGGNRSVFDSTFGKVNEKNLDKTNSYLLASAHPAI
ncbi:hypothetical protein, partial [Klebsiella pneumoniae]|uniref:hypothetical protein n=1 Tax=Klebsiella pneumoniae TaxID=573 RepID=UPI0032DB6E46